MPQKVQILVPLYNDWQALELLLSGIRQCLNERKQPFGVTVMNDCSAQPFEAQKFSGYDLEVIHLLRNVGHQKAIAIGLSHLSHNADIEHIIVMDSDGEDKPEDIGKLLDKAEESPQSIVFAQRSKRSEGFVFRFFYVIYRSIFSLLTGSQISFGNFSVIPQKLIKKVAFVHEIWNNYPGGVIRSKLPFTSVPIERGTRLAGKSKMNFVSLVLHGMSAISVFLDTTAVRIMIAASAMILFSTVGILVVLYFKIVAQIATPGWASSLASGFFIILLQGFFISLFMVFTVLSYRSNKHFVPLLDYKPFIDRIEKLPANA